VLGKRSDVLQALGPWEKESQTAVYLGYDSAWSEVASRVIRAQTGSLIGREKSLLRPLRSFV
jgi:hypothetical protein